MLDLIIWSSHLANFNHGVQPSVLHSPCHSLGLPGISNLDIQELYEEDDPQLVAAAESEFMDWCDAEYDYENLYIQCIYIYCILHKI